MALFIGPPDILSTWEAVRISEEVDLGLSLRSPGKNMPQSLKIGCRVFCFLSRNVGIAGSTVTQGQDFPSSCEVPR